MQELAAVAAALTLLQSEILATNRDASSLDLRSRDNIVLAARSAREKVDAEIRAKGELYR